MAEIDQAGDDAPDPHHDTEHVSLTEGHCLSEPERELAGQQPVEGDGEDEVDVGDSGNVDGVSGDEAHCVAQDPLVVVKSNYNLGDNLGDSAG